MPVRHRLRLPAFPMWTADPQPMTKTAGHHLFPNVLPACNARPAKMRRAVRMSCRRHGGLYVYPTRVRTCSRDGRTRRAALGNKPLRGRPGLFPVISRIDRCRRIWMQRAHPYFGRIAENVKLILVFRFFMMHTHLVHAQHDKHRLAGRIIHRPAPRASTHELVSIPDVKARLTRRAFRCAGQAIQDLVAGHIDLMLTAPNIALEQVRAGILAYADADKSRLPSAPEVPTVEEARIARVLRLALACVLGAQRHTAGGGIYTFLVGRIEHLRRPGDRIRCRWAVNGDVVTDLARSHALLMIEHEVRLRLRASSRRSPGNSEPR